VAGCGGCIAVGQIESTETDIVVAVLCIGCDTLVEVRFGAGFIARLQRNLAELIVGCGKVGAAGSAEVVGEDDLGFLRLVGAVILHAIFEALGRSRQSTCQKQGVDKL